MTSLPFPMSANLEGELSETNPFLNMLRSRVAALLMLFVSLLYPFEAFSATCAQQASLTCLDSTPCKIISGVEVCLAGVSPLPAGAVQSAQTCWQAQGSYACLDAVATNDTCADLRNDQTCGVISSKCIDTNPNTGECSVYTDTYQCQTGGGLATTSTDCSGQTYCSNGMCFEKKDKPNNALVKVVTAMELSRQSGFYMDPATQTIFAGVPQWCSQNNLGLADCCKPEASGKDFDNAMITEELIKGGWNHWVRDVVGSTYTFDSLFDKATGFVDRAINGMEEVVQTKAAANASTSVTGQVNSAATPGAAATAPPGASVGGMIGGQLGASLGSSLIGSAGGNNIAQGVGAAAGYAAGTVAGTYIGAAGYSVVAEGTLSGAMGAGSGAVGTICVACIVAVAVVMIVMAMLACDMDEIKTQMKLGAGICHNVGSFCSSKDFLGNCWTTHQNYCCFNSKLAKIVQEQGRPQIGKGWGTPESPECSGFTVDQLQGLDFSKMDLSEFFADVKAKAAVDTAKITADIGQRLGEFYANTPTAAMNGTIPGPTAGVPTPLTVTVNDAPTAPVMPACDTSLLKQAPVSNGDQTGTFTVTSCLANGMLDWVYTGNCPAMQGTPAIDTAIDAAGTTTFTPIVAGSCLLTGTTPATINSWTGRVIDTPTGGIVGRINLTW